MRKLAFWALLICMSNALLLIYKALFTDQRPVYNGIMAGSFALLAIACLVRARKEEK